MRNFESFEQTQISRLTLSHHYANLTSFFNMNEHQVIQSSTCYESLIMQLKA